MIQLSSALENKTVWLVFHAIFDGHEKSEPESIRYCGAFSTKKEAVSVALDVHENCYVVPSVIGSKEWATPHNQGSNPKAFYPAYE